MDHKVEQKFEALQWKFAELSKKYKELKDKADLMDSFLAYKFGDEFYSFAYRMSKSNGRESLGVSQLKKMPAMSAETTSTPPLPVIKENSNDSNSIVKLDAEIKCNENTISQKSKLMFLDYLIDYVKNSKFPIVQLERCSSHIDRVIGKKSDKSIALYHSPKNNGTTLEPKHLRIFSKNEEKIACKSSKSFESSHGLTNNLRKFHKEKRPSYSCKICRKSYTQSHNLKRHLETYHQVKGKSFLANKVSRKKVQKPTNSTTFKCQICLKTFARAMNLKLHNFRLHSERKASHSCKICHKNFKISKNLRNHMAVVHEGIKLFKCKICTKSFVQNINLLNHSRTHTGEKPYICTKCPRRFVQLTQLNRK